VTSPYPGIQKASVGSACALQSRDGRRSVGRSGVISCAVASRGTLQSGGVGRMAGRVDAAAGRRSLLYHIRSDERQRNASRLPLPTDSQRSIVHSLARRSLDILSSKLTTSTGHLAALVDGDHNN